MGTMTTREARIGLLAFALLFAGLAFNLLGRQTVPQPGTSMMVPERPVTGNPERTRRPSVRSADDASKIVPPVGTPAAPRRDEDSESAETVRAIQRELRARGYETGGTDGVPVLMTRAAIMAYEHDQGLTLTGDANEDMLKRILFGVSTTDRSNRSSSPREARPNAVAVIRTVQQNLVTLGYTPGRVDGQMRSDTQQAIREFADIDL